MVAKEVKGKIEYYGAQPTELTVDTPFDRESKACMELAMRIHDHATTTGYNT